MSGPHDDDCRNPVLGARGDAWGPILDMMVKDKFVETDDAHGVHWTKGARLVSPFFARPIREARQRAGLKQNVAAKRVRFWNGDKFCGTTDSKISRLESAGTSAAPMDLIDLSVELAGKARRPDTLANECMGLVEQVVGERGANSPEAGILHDAVNAAREAGTYLYNVASPSREDEKEAERRIEACLANRNVTVILGRDSERAKILGDLSHLDEEQIVYMVSAVEGFRMFQHRIPMWCTAIGAGRWQNGELQPICGVVFHPPSQEMFVGLIGGGAVLMHEGNNTVTPLKPSERFVLNDLMVGTHLSTSKLSATNAFVRRWLEKLPIISERIVMLGSGQLALAYTADGRLDVFMNVSTEFWHVFAGKIILDVAAEKLGSQAVVTDFLGQPWNYESEGVLACGNQYAHQSLLGLIRVLSHAM